MATSLTFATITNNSVSEPSTVTEIVNILAQIVVILYAVISLLKERPINWGKVLAKLGEALVLLLSVIKLIKRKKKRDKDVSND